MVRKGDGTVGAIGSVCPEPPGARGTIGPASAQEVLTFTQHRYPLLWVVSALMRRWIIMGAWHAVRKQRPRLASEGRWTMVGSKEGAVPRACNGMIVGYT